MLNAKLAPWTRHGSRGRAKANCDDGDSFVIKYVSYLVHAQLPTDRNQGVLVYSTL